MQVIPAIDIKGGRCVRLYQGDYERETVFSDSPLDAAARWVGDGASRLHVVDLDGAKAGAPVNIGIVGEIAASVPTPVELGGGIRTLDTAKEAISRGVNRVVIGSAAVEGPALVEEMCRCLGAESVVVSVDARDGYVVVRGWTKRSRLLTSELVKRIEALGVLRFVYTDVARDGTLTEPNFRAIEDLAGRTQLKMLVAGGISSLGHLVKMSEIGVEAAIVGTAVYTGAIDLREAIVAVEGPKSSTV